MDLPKLALCAAIASGCKPSNEPAFVDSRGGATRNESTLDSRVQEQPTPVPSSSSSPVVAENVSASSKQTANRNIAGGVNRPAVTPVPVATPTPTLIPDEEIIQAQLDQLRWELPCLRIRNVNIDCDTELTDLQSTHLEASDNAIYDVTLRFRGVVEDKRYVNATSQSGFFVQGGQPPSDEPHFNIYRLSISSPQQTFFLNGSHSNVRNVYYIDYVRTVSVRGNAQVTLEAQSLDRAQIYRTHLSDVLPAQKDVAEDLRITQGQFIQMDVVSVDRRQN